MATASSGAIGDVPRVQRDGDERQRLGQTDHPERQRIARHLEDLPSDHDDLRLSRDRRGRINRDQPEKVSDAQRA